ncbi:MAG TPA: hypothetical protein VLB47_15995 [Solirubrobacteraceae bacterium]|nr:hypothetical protein [Solirubrobacteraceae bacterium]
MAWDFSTDPGVQERLDWTRALVREQIWPLETLAHDLDRARGARFYDGPYEVHRQSATRQILRGYEPPPDGVPGEHVPTRPEAARRRFAAVLDAVTAND